MQIWSQNQGSNQHLKYKYFNTTDSLQVPVLSGVALISLLCHNKMPSNVHVYLGKDKAVARHFNLPGHSSSDMRFLPFEVVTGDSTLLASREEFWIRKKKTLESGINLQK